MLNVALFAWKPRAALLVDTSYIATILIFSVAAARKAAWILLPVLPIVFAVYHFAYGAGFLWGCVRAIV